MAEERFREVASDRDLGETYWGGGPRGSGCKLWSGGGRRERAEKRKRYQLRLIKTAANKSSICLTLLAVVSLLPL